MSHGTSLKSTASADLKDIMLQCSKTFTNGHICMISLIEAPEGVEFTKTENKVVGARSWGRGGWLEFNGDRVSVCPQEEFWG